MQPTVYQKPEIRDANDNIIQQGAFSKNTALCTATNDGWIDYVANDLEFLYDLAKDEVVPVPALPASGQTNKTYLLTTTGVSYRWSGTEWVAVSSSEAVGRAETAANLAEQWATKTDGTVDGSEYSAKYYAEQAGQSADDAQDVADDMADHLVQIDKNTGGVSKNSKRISNIEKLLQGNLYDYDTDDDVAYTKTVPSGALPYAGVEQIGGKTLVWNQLNSNNGASGTVNGITYTKNNDGSWTLNGTSTNTANKTFTGTLTLTVGHKYYVHGCPAGGGSSSYTLGFSGLGTDKGNGGIWTATLSGVIFRFNCASGVTFNNVTMYPQYHDLSLMFGAGNEPTLDQCREMFPAQYYPYNAGTLLSAGVESVESLGVNLLDGVTLVQGSFITETGAEVSVTDRVRTDFVDIKPNTEYTATVGGTNVEVRAAYYYRADKSYIGRTILDATVITTISPQNAFYVRLLYRFTDDSTIVPSDVVNPLFFKENITYSVPAEVQALEGYGWSAGNVYNYVDLEKKVLVKRVGSVKIKNLGWSYNPTYRTFWIRENALTLPMKAQTQPANVICPKYATTIPTGISEKDKVIIADNTFMSIVDTSFNGDVNSFKTNMGEADIYYELATPIETDISDYLTDNLIEVGAGGTLTFENSNGNDYHIPVPSEVTYMIDLQEAISNG